MPELETYEMDNRNLLSAMGGDEEDEGNHLRCLFADGGDEEDEGNHLRCLY